MGNFVRTRRYGESITVDGPATIIFAGNKGRAGRLVVQAPESTKITLGERQRQDTKPVNEPFID
ncbi:MAG: carbon storage regulator [Planctomycetes bacterium]|nr:carbon storage regulator [Planctomycetota bacterium]